MSKVHLLSQSISNMIAAGEVVERPSSVVKELVENAIDAKATHIDIVIKDAGRTLIKVIDDGVGMDKEDALLALKRHATSKIYDEKDLFNISTLGFRGEALPSIAAVSHLVLTTSTGTNVGTRVEVNGSEIVSVENAHLRKGTEIEVNELFYNTPARLKYLKSDNTEFAAIHDVVVHIALGYPNIIFTLQHNDKIIFKSNGNGNVLEIISEIYGKETARNMQTLKADNYDFSVNGYISKIQINRANRYSMITLLNGRYVRMLQVNNAIIEAYRTYLPDGRYPISVINIEVDPSLVDINVHPSKHEVRLSKEKELVTLIKEAVISSLKEELQTPSFTKPTKEKEIVLTPTLNLDSDNFFTKDEIKEEVKEVYVEPLILEEKEIPSQVNEIKEEVKEESSLIYFRVIGQHHGTYILCEFDNGLYIIDQHAAAERINFEKYSRLLGSTSASIPLLIPLLLEYTYNEIKQIEENRNILETLGIYFETFSNTNIRISEVPSYFIDVDMEVYAKDVIEMILNKVKVSSLDIRLNAIATIACKASIKANHSLSENDMMNLVKNLLKCENPNTCPHGRPTMLKYTNYELEKFFKRAG